MHLGLPSEVWESEFGQTYGLTHDNQIVKLLTECFDCDFTIYLERSTLEFVFSFNDLNKIYTQYLDISKKSECDTAIEINKQINCCNLTIYMHALKIKDAAESELERILQVILQIKNLKTLELDLIPKYECIYGADLFTIPMSKEERENIYKDNSTFVKLIQENTNLILEEPYCCLHASNYCCQINFKASNHNGFVLSS